MIESLIQDGIKVKDACHVACAILADCSYFITTDDRLLKYCSEQIQLVSPCEFIRKMEADEFMKKASAYADDHPYKGNAKIIL